MSIGNLRERCKERLRRPEEAALYTDLLRESNVGTLELIIKDESCLGDYRAAALEGMLYPSVRTSEDFVREQVRSDSDEVRRVARLWLHSIEDRARGCAFVDEGVRGRGGVVQTCGGFGPEEQDWHKEAADDPSPRVNFIATLGE